jgi:ABC-2 type transport system permease protein
VTDRGVVFDLGYQPHDGPRLGTAGAVSATIKDGLRRVLGLRRKARRKILPWSLLAIALLPAVVFVGLAFFVGEFVPEADSPFGGYEEYLGLAGTVLLIFSALAAPELLVPDRVEGVLAVYSSRPMRARDYVGARAAALLGLVGAFLFVPNTLMWIGFSSLAEGNFVTEAVNGAGDLLRALAASTVYVLAYGVPAMLPAFYTKRAAPASGVYLAVMLFSVPVAELLASSGFTAARWAALLALLQHPHVVRDWIFDTVNQDLPTTYGFEPWASLLVILGVATLTVVLGMRRYRREM